MKGPDTIKPLQYAGYSDGSWGVLETNSKRRGDFILASLPIWIREKSRLYRLSLFILGKSKYKQDLKVPLQQD